MWGLQRKLERGRCGLLAEKNPEAMANGILRLLEHPEAKASRTKAAFERAVGEFSVPQSATAYGKALGVYT